ncbi:MAG: LysE family translocator [Loktanella sp.]|nr:LysE family translocator [Loktanella sp.]
MPEVTLLAFVFVGLFSPGPNVILLTASGARFGFRATLPHIFGVAFGVGVTSGLTGLGIGTLLLAQPRFTLVLKLLACGWLLWMAYKLWTSGPAGRRSHDRPFTFVEAVLFQWVNPKVWAVALSATAFVATLPPATQATQLALSFSGINLGVCLFWTGAGAVLAFLLNTPLAWQIFTKVMAAALVIFSGLVFI